MAKINIIVNNNKCRIDTTTKLLIQLRNHKKFRIRAPGAFYSQAFRSRRWDGYVHYITEKGLIDTGRLPVLLHIIKKELNKKYVLRDERDVIKVKTVVKDLNSYKLRPYQSEAVKSVIKNKVEGIPFQRGIIAAATNAGKTIISASIHETFNKKTIFLINSTDLFQDALEEIPKFLPGKVGYISSKAIEWNDFMICMVKTTANRITSSYEVREKVSDYDVCLVDECDLATSKTYKTVLDRLWMCSIKVGLSGSVFLHKDKTKNEAIRGFFGEKIFEITNKKLIDSGYSSDVIVNIVDGNTKYSYRGDYDTEYDHGIIRNKARNKLIEEFTLSALIQDRGPILIITRFHKHIKILHRRLSKSISDPFTVAMVHHETPERHPIVKDFKEGKVDVLIGSYILKRGKNFPLMKTLINAGGGDSVANVLQILGRATRKHESKEYTDLIDFYDQGSYIRKHSLHRVKCYKNEGIKVKENYSKTIIFK